MSISILFPNRFSNKSFGKARRSRRLSAVGAPHTAFANKRSKLSVDSKSGLNVIVCVLCAPVTCFFFLQSMNNFDKWKMRRTVYRLYGWIKDNNNMTENVERVANLVDLNEHCRLLFPNFKLRPVTMRSTTPATVQKPCQEWHTRGVS